jgi:VIT1/CCC1 family predicted Fe2+/Mn2+ transporter
VPQSPHVERHFQGSAAVRDVVIGMADGLTVPFALAAGLSGAAASSGIVVTAGIAEIAAGSIAMGLGGYLAARSDVEHYASEREREVREVKEKKDAERDEVSEVFEGYGLTKEQIAPILDAFEKDHPAWVDFMMRFELGLEQPDPRRARTSALTIAGAYIAGGLVPLAPSLFLPSPREARMPSVVLTIGALFAFGWVKGRFTGVAPLKSALQTTLVGGLAAGAAFGNARQISG